MNTLSDSMRSILHILEDGSCHSGNDLGAFLGISRAAIWKQIKQLIELGLPIKSVPQQGYQLRHEFYLLDAETIRNQLISRGFLSPINLHIVPTINSTNLFLKELPISAAIELCCAESQTQGRGRFGRHWHSPFGENIYCSIRWSYEGDLSHLSGLSLVISLAVLASLDELNHQSTIQVKWPNDILWHNKKLCGSLIEILAESNSTTQIIVGIGLNVNSDTLNNPLTDRPWCSLYEIAQCYTNRNTQIVTLVIKLQEYLNRFLNHGFAGFMDEWREYDFLAGKTVTLTHGTSTLRGLVLGVNESGQLILQDELGKVHYLSSGETTLS